MMFIMMMTKKMKSKSKTSKIIIKNHQARISQIVRQEKMNLWNPYTIVHRMTELRKINK